MSVVDVWKVLKDFESSERPIGLSVQISGSLLFHAWRGERSNVT